MGYVNQVVLQGNLVSDPECVALKDGAELCRLRMAVNNRRSKKDETLFIDVTVFGGQVPFCKTYLNTGKEITVIGRLQSSQYEDKDTGKKRTSYQIIASDIQTPAAKKDKVEETF